MAILANTQTKKRRYYYLCLDISSPTPFQWQIRDSSAFSGQLGSSQVQARLQANKKNPCEVNGAKREHLLRRRSRLNTSRVDLSVHL